MTGLPFHRRKSNDQAPLQPQLQLAQAGDQVARNDLIESYTPFVLRIASQLAGRYIERGRDDEFSIGLVAMNEAIDRFDCQKSTSFLGFAETIIRRRLIDYYRSQRSHSQSVPWTDLDIVDEEENVINYADVRLSLAAHHREQLAQRRRMEIAEYSLELAAYGLTFSALAAIAPKHADARQSAMDVAKVVVADAALCKYVADRKSLPLRELEGRVSVSRKTLERQRKYILAIVVLLNGDFEHLQGYIS